MPWRLYASLGYRWALQRLRPEYEHQRFGMRDRVERWFRELKDRAKMFCNNVNLKTVKNIEGIATPPALIQNRLQKDRRRCDA